MPTRLSSFDPRTPPAEAPVGEGLICQQVEVAAERVWWVRYICEAYDGLTTVFSDRSGCVWLITPESQQEEAESLRLDLEASSG